MIPTPLTRPECATPICTAIAAPDDRPETVMRAVSSRAVRGKAGDSARALAAKPSNTIATHANRW